MTRDEKLAVLETLNKLGENIKKFILNAPEFQGDKELAAACGKQFANLEFQIKKIQDK